MISKISLSRAVIREYTIPTTIPEEGTTMLINTKAMISITEANQHFSSATKLADQNGRIVIMKNNKPAYVLSSFQDDSLQFASDESVRNTAKELLKEYREDFLKMAK